MDFSNMLECLYLESFFKTILGRLARDKHSSLLRKSVNYGRNKFYITGPKNQGLYNKTYYGRNVQFP